MPEDRFFLFICRFLIESASSKLKSSGIRYEQKMFESGPANWRSIQTYLEDPALMGVIGKLTGNTYQSIASPEYADVTRPLFESLGRVPHIMFIHESVLTGPRHAIAGDAEETYFYESWDMPDADTREIANQLLAECRVQVVPYMTNAELSVMAASFVDDNDQNLLFRIYVPSGRIYAAEADSLLSLFQDWLSKIAGHGIRQDGYQTSAGQVYEFFGTGDLDAGQLSHEFDQFTSFAKQCIQEPDAASARLSAMGFDRIMATDLVARFGRQIRRLNLDLRQEWEARALIIKHDLESALLDATFEHGVPAIAIDALFETYVPRPGVEAIQMLSPVGISPTYQTPASVTINQQIINAVGSSIIQNVQGTVHLEPQAKELLNLIRQFGAESARALESDLMELEDPDARAPDRLGARQRLKGFLIQLAGVAEQAAVGSLVKYVETKFGL